MASEIDQDALHAVMQRTVQGFLDSHNEAIRACDITILSRTLNPTCLRRYAPAHYIRQKGLDPEEHAFKNTAYESHAKKEYDLFESIRIVVLDTCTDVLARKSWVWCQHWTRFKDTDKEMCQECVWMFTFTEEGEKITSLRQFLDTAAVELFVKKQNDAGITYPNQMDDGR